MAFSYHISKHSASSYQSLVDRGAIGGDGILGLPLNSSASRCLGGPFNVCLGLFEDCNITPKI